jgi:YjbE family integral membrane protein
MDFHFSLEALTALVSVIAIDVALAGDNAIVVGMAAAGLPPEQRRKAIIAGIAAAAVMRIVFAVFTVQLMEVIGLMFAGGLLLLWVSWKLWREIQTGAAARQHGELTVVEDPTATPRPPKSFRDSVLQIMVADVSMSLDNVLAVAGAAREHAWVLIVGLALSVALMGLAATIIARMLHRYHWLAYVGLAIILYVALRMIWDGGHTIITATQLAGPL